MRLLVRMVPVLACAAVLVVGFTVFPSNTIRADVLSDTQMGAIVGSCDCNGVQLKDECKEDSCPGCGLSGPVGTGVKYNVCTSGDPNTGVCKKDGDRKLCTEKYNCDAPVDPESGQKCNAAKDGCIAGSTSDNCILCNKGYKWTEDYNTYKQSYKCE